MQSGDALTPNNHTEAAEALRRLADAIEGNQRRTLRGELVSELFVPVTREEIVHQLEHPWIAINENRVQTATLRFDLKEEIWLSDPQSRGRDS